MNENSYQQITQEAAKEMMDTQEVVILDVREQHEYDSGHISGALCLPVESIGTEVPAELPDKDAEILIYCRSGRRSAEAARKLIKLGYTNICDFGGIQDWPYGTVTE